MFGQAVLLCCFKLRGLASSASRTCGIGEIFMSNEQDADEPIMALCKYFARAEALRLEMMEATAGLNRLHRGKPFELFIPPTKRGERIPEIDIQHNVLVMRYYMFLDYWHAALWVVVEGYNKLGLKDKRVARILSNPLTPKLKDYRDGTYHFKPQYFDVQTSSLRRASNALRWVNDLHEAFHYVLDEKARDIEARQNTADVFKQLSEDAAEPLDRRLASRVWMGPAQRNARCHCGSGKRYKLCHGRVT